MLVLTFGEHPRGVYQSQVIDACRTFESLGSGCKLLAFVPHNSFLKSRKIIKTLYANSLVVPMIPYKVHWRLNNLLLILILLFFGERSILCRGVQATNLALDAKKLSRLKHIGYDARGAIAAEWEEYLYKKYKPRGLRDIRKLESRAIAQSDIRLAVSEQLLLHWRERYAYASEKHVVLPCTLNSSEPLPALSKNETQRLELGFGKEDLVFVYAGSAADWQSFNLIEKTMADVLQKNNTKLLLLCPESDFTRRMQVSFPNKVKQRWLKPSEVLPYLASADIALLLREPSLTNKVASPTKFAQYLAAGLKVLISTEIGDFSAFVKEHNCGYLANTNWQAQAVKQNTKDRLHCQQLAKSFFLKSSPKNRKAYEQLLLALP